MALESFLEAYFPRTSHFESFLGAGIGLNLRHDLLFKHDTLLADPHRRVTLWALWAIKWSAKVGKSAQRNKKNLSISKFWPNSC